MYINVSTICLTYFISVVYLFGFSPLSISLFWLPFFVRVICLSFVDSLLSDCVVWIFFLFFRFVVFFSFMTLFVLWPSEIETEFDVGCINFQFQVCEWTFVSTVSIQCHQIAFYLIYWLLPIIPHPKSTLLSTQSLSITLSSLFITLFSLSLYIYIHTHNTINISDHQKWD